MPLSATDKAMLDRIETAFTYHPPRGNQPARYERLRAEARALARTIVELVPDSRERSLALTKLEEVIMWANAGVSRESTE